MTEHLQGLLPTHVAHLRASGLTDDTIAAAGIYSETDPRKVCSLLGRRKAFSSFAPAIIFPFKTATGSNGYYRARPDTPRRDRNDRPIKYESPVELPNQIYLPPGVAQYLADPKQELLITEGEKKALAATQEGFPCIGLVGVYGYVVKGHKRLIPEMESIAWQGREVRIVFDSPDIVTNKDVQAAAALLAKLLADQGAKVRCPHLPDGPPGEDGKPTKVGLDDFISGRGANAKRDLRKLLDNADEPPAINPADLKEKAANADPAGEALAFLKLTEQDGVRRLIFWRGEFYFWSVGRYSPLQLSEVRAKLITSLNQWFSFVTTGVVTNILEQVKAQALLSARVKAPAWLEEPPQSWKPADVIAARNGLISLPAFAAGEDYLCPATPRFLSTSALDYEFSADALPPARWLEFLAQLWADDQASIDTLQEWFGYCLTADTRQQKILLIVGPKRSGKGTIARVLSAVIGHDNTAGPTLSGLASQFGLWPLLDKSVAIIADARLSGRTDQAIVVERLLSISGEDATTVDRKCMEPIKNVTLPTRLMILTNELPRLGDSSGALAGRFIVLKLTKSFFGKEDIALTDALLTERPGILLWAIEGWQRLLARGHFVQPAAGEELSEQMEEISSPVGEFVRECCILDPTESVTVHDLYCGWCWWCDRTGRKPGSEQIFGRDLSAAMPQIKRCRPRDSSGACGRVRAYLGIDLTASVADTIRRIGGFGPRGPRPNPEDAMVSERNVNDQEF